MIVDDPANPDFQAQLPSCIDYAEQRIYSELDLLSTVVRTATHIAAAQRDFALPTQGGRFVVVNGINLITPASAQNASSGKRNQLVPASRDYLDAVGGDNTFIGVPTNYAMITDQNIIVGPAWPDQQYLLEVVGTVRPAPLDPTVNTSTFLTNFLPQVWFAATMVFMTGWQQNFGSQSDNPQMAQSWESQYKTLSAAVNIEEQRKRYAAGAWASLSPTPAATPTR
ncbi:hypothetical protein J6497_12715 [Bradyrhizobium sp. CNPSo 4026]|uniref:phage adaptor protein n=1 Tax=Bradyrhizobium cenepequi TaxID=2821403 RepID=UPI001CE37813|nr:hypothetical protein [Bradyrhizobium cenepequi]MCA6108096.1 hypothetical protein [Bradyrhizobium cenepequi]